MVATLQQKAARPQRWSGLRYHPEQARLRNSPARFKVVEAGRRSGKTEQAKRDGTDGAFTAHDHSPHVADFRTAYLAPTRDQVKRIYWADVLALIPRPFIRSVNRSELCITLENDAEIWFLGMERPERMDGIPWDRLFWDEVGDCKQGIWDRHIRPAISTDGRPGKAWIYGVPRPSAEFERLADYAKDPNRPDWDYFHWISADIVSPEEVAEARATMDPLLYAQEFEASRVNLQGLAYYQFNRTVNLRALNYDPRQPLVVCFDFNVEPGTASMLQEFDPRTLGDAPEGHRWAETVTGCVGEVYIPRHSNTHRVCQAVIDQFGEHEGLVYGYGDATGGGRSTASARPGDTDWTIINDVMGRHFGDRWRDYHKRSNPRERARVNAVNARLCTADHTVGFLADPERAPNLIKDFERTMVLEGTAGELDKKSDPMATHMTDEVGYYVEQEFPAIDRGVSSEPFA